MGRHQTRLLLISAVAVAVVGAALIRTESRSLMCPSCRAVLTVRSLASYEYAREVSHNKCSRWFAEHDPSHRHLWVTWGCTVTTNLLPGAPVRYSMPARRHELHRVLPDEQLQVLRGMTPDLLEHFVSMANSGRAGDREGAVEIVQEGLDGL